LPVSYGIDLASQTPAPSALVAARVGFVCRYLSPEPSKNLTRAEAVRLHAAGISIVTVWEWTADRARQGWAAGVQDAHGAQALLNALGAPRTAVVYFAVDYDATGQTQRTDAYFDGAASVLGKHRVGVYGGLAVIARAAARGYVYLWQTYAWSGGVWHPKARLRQYSNDHTVAGASVDLDQAMTADFGQWFFIPPKPVVMYGYRDVRTYTFPGKWKLQAYAAHKRKLLGPVAEHAYTLKWKGYWYLQLPEASGLYPTPQARDAAMHLRETVTGRKLSPFTR
jgi:hypothetical protein